VEAVVAAGAAFLLAVLWFDLMHDVLVRGHTEPALPESVLAPITGYYRRVVVDAHPMNKLVAIVMMATLIAIVVEWGEVEAWVSWLSLAGSAGAIGLALTRTVRTAGRLGLRQDDAVTQSELARQCYRDHVVCFVAMTSVLAAQLVASW